MRVAVHLNLPNLYKDHQAKQAKFEKILKTKNVNIVRLEQKENIFEVTNNLKLGPSEIQQIQDVYDTVV
jgi:hypothetical protein